MKIAELKTLVASALLFVTASTQALQPEVLYGFEVGPTNATGAHPRAELALGSDGDFYGTTSEGGSNGYGTVFKVTASGALTSLVSFPFPPGGNCEGSSPSPSRLVLGNDGSFYGTTAGCPFFFGSFPGSVFRVTTDGTLTRLATNTWLNPRGALVLGDGGDFYGTTWDTLFKITSNGDLTTVALIVGDNGAGMGARGLVLGRDGAFYGSTEGGGGSGNGTVFNVTTNGILTTLVSFNGTNGASPGELLLGRDGIFYGTTERGGSSNYGTVFKVTTSGVLTSLASFSLTNGANPYGRLVQGRDGNFYGTTYYGGSSGNGTVFRVTPNGVLTSLASFTGDDGRNPFAGLILGSEGKLYGTTSSGGPGGGGTIFRLVISTFTSVARQPGGTVLLTGTGPANGGYRLWASADLSLPVAFWTLLTSASFDSNGNFSYTDAGAATHPSRFYQLSNP